MESKLINPSILILACALVVSLGACDASYSEDDYSRFLGYLAENWEFTVPDGVTIQDYEESATGPFGDHDAVYSITVTDESAAQGTWLDGDFTPITEKQSALVAEIVSTADASETVPDLDSLLCLETNYKNDEEDSLTVCHDPDAEDKQLLIFERLQD